MRPWWPWRCGPVASLLYGDELPARRHGLVRMLLAALRCCGEGWRQEDMLALVKSGFAPLTEEEAFRLENYALENGIRGTKWTDPLPGR